MEEKEKKEKIDEGKESLKKIGRRIRMKGKLRNGRIKRDGDVKKIGKGDSKVMMNKDERKLKWKRSKEIIGEKKKEIIR